jgi:hypothetical protein
VDIDPYAVTASEQAAMSRRLETLVASAAGNDTIDLTDRASGVGRPADHAVEARLAAIESRIERLQDAVIEGFGGARSRLADDLALLRGDLADALDEVREQVETAVALANTSIASTLEQHGAAASSVLEGVQAEVKSGLAEMSRSLTGQFAAIRGVTGTLGGGTERLVGAGQALLAYLGERDRWLEAERDRVLHEVLEDFAQGLSGRRRRALSSRMRDVVDRRRDARDAERFRQTADGTTVIEIPPLPPELTVLSEPLPEPVAQSAEEPTVRIVGTSAPKSGSTPQKSPSARKAVSSRPPNAKTGPKKAPSGATSTAQNRAKRAASGDPA